MSDHSPCELCLDDPCESGCAEWLEYWNNLTPAEQREELLMMDRYAQETDE